MGRGGESWPLRKEVARRGACVPCECMCVPMGIYVCAYVCVHVHSHTRAPLCTYFTCVHVSFAFTFSAAQEP